MLDWDDLRFFLAVARHRTLALAAKHLHVTQSTVSRRLAALQEGMGVRLLQRTAEGVVRSQVTRNAGLALLGRIADSGTLMFSGEVRAWIEVFAP